MLNLVRFTDKFIVKPIYLVYQGFVFLLIDFVNIMDLLLLETDEVLHFLLMYVVEVCRLLLVAGSDILELQS